MFRTMECLVLAGALGLLIAGTGCNDPKAKAEPVVDQHAAAAAERIAQLQKDLAEARNGWAADRNRLNQMQAEIDRLNQELSKGTKVAEGWTPVPGGAMISIEGTVLFDSGKAILKPGGKTTLNAVAATIKSQYPGAEIYVFGHTDSEPIRKSSWTDNYELSCERSLSVVRYLRAQGDANYMAACGWGEHRPVAANSSAASRQQNRRVQIFAMTPTTKGEPAVRGTATQ
ncbi:MAG TPA: OmpA family protein [Phycisphaerae bacterium]|nr:OmpA family protein [Phycisphaerae bacterium]HRY68222.1 OmpA family protein [Phycisphaerae bacterium]HSA28595.1 OmpA family protein [Phycisphaerae bacterium]